MQVSRLEEFFDNNNPLISDVIVWHLRLESLITELLRRLPAEFSEAKIRKMTFSRKAKILYEQGELTKPLYRVIQKMNRLRNAYAHDLGFEPECEFVHSIIVMAGAAGVDFSDAIDNSDPSYAKSLNYDHYMLMNSLFRNVFYDVAWAQGEDFWKHILA